MPSADLAASRGRRARLGLLLSLIAALVLTVMAPSPASAAKLDFKVLRKHGQFYVRANPDRTPLSFSVKVNKRSVGGLFHAPGPGRAPVEIGLDDGLRFGPNKAVAVFRFADGSRIKRARKFKVKSDLPLVGAGRTVHTVDGRRLRLGRKKGHRLSKAARADAPRVIRTWKLIRRPAGSKAKLRRKQRGAKRPKFTPDVHGTYLLRLRVRVRPPVRAKGEAAGPKERTKLKFREDVLQVEAEDKTLTPSGVLMSTEVSGGKISNIRLYNGASAGAYAVSQPQGSMVLLFDRQTLELLTTRSGGTSEGDLSAIQTLIANQQKKLDPLNHDLLAVISANGACEAGPFFSLFEPYLADLAGEPQETGCQVTVVATPRVKSGFFNGFDEVATSRTSGYLQRGALGDFAFVPAYPPVFGQALLRFDTKVPSPPADSNVMSIAGTTFTSQALNGGCQGGFHVVWLDSRTLLPHGSGHPSGQRTFTTNCGGNPTVEIGDMADYFDGLDATSLLFLQGIGEPRPAGLGNNTEWFATGDALTEGIGATRNAFNEPDRALNDPGPQPSPNHYYALVGNGDRRVLEAGGWQPNPVPVRLAGVLQRSRTWRFQARGGPGGGLAGTATNPGRLGLVQAAYEVDQTSNPSFGPTRYPHAGEQQWEAALGYAASAAVLKLRYDPAGACFLPPNGSSNVRSSYCGGAPAGFWLGKAAVLANAPYPGPGNGFSALTWAEVKQRLVNVEFPLIEGLNGAVRELQRPFGAEEIEAVVDLDAIVSFVNEKVTALEQQELSGDGLVSEILVLIEDVLFFAAPFTGGLDLPIEGAIGVVASAVGVASDGVTLASGAPALGPPLPGTTANTLKEQLVDNYQLASESLGPLRDMIAADWLKLRTWDQSGIDPDADDVVAGSPAIVLGTQQYIYAYFISSIYEAELCTLGGTITPGPGSGQFYQDVVGGIGGPEYVDYGLNGPGIFPPHGILEPLYQPINLNGEIPVVNTSSGAAQSPLGIYKPYFWNRNWDSLRNAPQNALC